MITETDKKTSIAQEVEPLCPVFRSCGGCEYQHLSYDKELAVKRENLIGILAEVPNVEARLVDPVERSPREYHYRHRLDLTLRRFRREGLLLGFQAPGTKRMIEVEQCPIAREEVSDFIPELRKQAIQKMPEKYRTANLVVRTGDEGRVAWGGIGRRSLRMQSEDYLWTEVYGKRIYFSLETFFQANTFILPQLMDKIESLANFDQETLFLDLYAGVGLFGIYFADKVKQVVMVEEVKASSQLMDYNINYHQLENAQNHCSRVEEMLLDLLDSASEKRKIAMIDPPRKGLSPEVLETLTKAKKLESLFYLSCHPESLARDLKGFAEAGWRVEKVMPFDFFPRTRHLETLVLLKP